MQPETTVKGTLGTILQTSSIDELWPIVVHALDQYGFDRIIFISTKFATKEHWGNMSDWLMLTNHDPKAIEAFIGSGMFLDTAKILWPPGISPGGYAWPELEEFRARTDLAQSQIDYAKLREEFDILAGYSIWFPEISERHKGVAGLCARRGLDQNDVGAIWKEHGEDILLIANLAHLKLSTLPHPDTRNRLSSRQYEILEWLADGKSGKDIAELLGISYVTVEKHLRQAREALAVETTAQAVQKVAVLNQLFLP